MRAGMLSSPADSLSRTHSEPHLVRFVAQNGPARTRSIDLAAPYLPGERLWLRLRPQTPCQPARVVAPGGLPQRPGRIWVALRGGTLMGLSPHDPRILRPA